MLDKMTIKAKIVSVTIIGLLLLSGILGIVAVTQATSSLVSKSYDGLTAVRDSKAEQIQNFFAERIGDINVLAKSADILDQPILAQSAYEKIVALAPGVSDIPQAKEIANNFVSSLSEFTPEKVKNCPALQG